MLYDALRAPFGLVVTGDVKRLRAAKAKLQPNDGALLDLAIVGPDRAGRVYLLRKSQCRLALEKKEANSERGT